MLGYQDTRVLGIQQYLDAGMLGYKDAVIERWGCWIQGCQDVRICGCWYTRILGVLGCRVVKMLEFGDARMIGDHET